MRLLVVMPDGTTLLARPAWLRGPDGSVLRLDVHPWTGEPTWTDLGRAESDLEPAAGAEDVESLADDAAAPAPDGPGGGRRGTGR